MAASWSAPVAFEAFAAHNLSGMDINHRKSNMPPRRTEFLPQEDDLVVAFSSHLLHGGFFCGGFGLRVIFVRWGVWVRNARYRVPGPSFGGTFGGATGGHVREIERKKRKCHSPFYEQPVIPIRDTVLEQWEDKITSGTVKCFHSRARR